MMVMILVSYLTQTSVLHLVLWSMLVSDLMQTLALHWVLLDDGKHQLLLAHATRVFNFKLVGLFEDFRHVQCLEFV